MPEVTQPASGPPPDAVREQLERMLASDAFATAGRHSRLLRYLTERALAGEGDQLKEYVLATEVFDRPASYDPRLDSIVRVEARRLRNRLEEYYRGPGQHDPIEISVPRGNYVPIFTTRRPHGHPDDAAATRRAPREQEPRFAARPLATVAGLAAITMLVTLAAAAIHGTRTASSMASRPAVAVLPFEVYASDERSVLLAARATDALTAALAAQGRVSVASRTSAARFPAGSGSMPQIAQALGVAYLVEASATTRGDRVRISARLVDGARDRKIWVGEYDLLADDIALEARRIAADVAEAAIHHTAR